MQNQLIPNLTRFTDSIGEKISPIYSEDKYQGQFTQVPFGLFRDKEMYIKLHKCIPIYMYLQTCVYRNVHGRDKFNLYEKYFLQGILAVSVPKSEIAKVHGHGPNKVREILNLLEKYKFIKKEKITTKYKKEGRLVNGQQNVYILGTHFSGKPDYLAGKINFCETRS